MLSNTIFEEVYSNMIFEQNNQAQLQQLAKKCKKCLVNINKKQGREALVNLIKNEPILQNLAKKLNIKQQVIQLLKSDEIVTEQVIYQEDQEENKQEQNKEQNSQQKPEEKKESKKVRKINSKKLAKGLWTITKGSYKVAKISIKHPKTALVIITALVLGFAWMFGAFNRTKAAAQEDLINTDNAAKRVTQQAQNVDKTLLDPGASTMQKADAVAASMVTTVKSMGQTIEDMGHTAKHPIDTATELTKQAGKNIAAGAKKGYNSVKGLFNKQQQKK